MEMVYGFFHKHESRALDSLEIEGKTKGKAEYGVANNSMSAATLHWLVYNCTSSVAIVVPPHYVMVAVSNQVSKKFLQLCDMYVPLDIRCDGYTEKLLRFTNSDCANKF